VDEKNIQMALIDNLNIVAKLPITVQLRFEVEHKIQDIKTKTQGTATMNDGLLVVKMTSLDGLYWDAKSIDISTNLNITNLRLSGGVENYIQV
jgi:hypothetical protein